MDCLNEKKRRRNSNPVAKCKCPECVLLRERRRKAANPDKRRKARHKWLKENPEKNREYCRKYREKNPEKVHETQRKNELKRKYGLTLEQYEEILSKQEGICVICHKPCPTGKRLAVDHKHETDKVRGLLCRPCNAALGLFKDSHELLRVAADYLEKGYR